MKKRLFYAPPGETPREIAGRVFRHPVTHQQIHNPKRDLGLDLLELREEPVLPPRSEEDEYDYVLVTERSDNDVVQTYQRTAQPMAEIRQRKLDQLWEHTRQRLDAPTANLDPVFLQLLMDDIPLSAYLRVDGTWDTMTPGQQNVLRDNRKATISNIYANTKAHIDAIETLASGNNRRALAQYDVTTILV